jgi:putative oxidoreductase
MTFGLLFLRVVIGGIFVAHGAQKLFGWWSGPGLAGMRGALAGGGWRLPSLMAVLVALIETSGLLLVLGLLTPFVALALIANMTVAIATVHWARGFWNANGGYEFNLSLIASLVAIAAIGPGRISLDRAIGWDDNLSGSWWGIAVLVLGVAAGLATVALFRRAPAPAEA